MFSFLLRFNKKIPIFAVKKKEKSFLVSEYVNF